MIAKVCDRESRRDSWFENRLVVPSTSFTGVNSRTKNLILMVENPLLNHKGKLNILLLKEEVILSHHFK